MPQFNPPRPALVSWSRGQDGWKGEILAGDVPRKIVFIDGARQGHPKGVEPQENVAFLCDILGETQPGEWRGVLFARPLCPASFGWVPTGEPIMGVSRQEWRCTDMPGAHVHRCVPPPPAEEPEANRLYQQASELLGRFSHSDLPIVFCEFGWPDSVVSGQSGQIRLIWEMVGERVVSPESLVRGLNRHCKPLAVYMTAKEACRPWPVEYIPGSMGELPPSRKQRRVNARFRFRHFPEIEFDLQVVFLDEWMATIPGERLLPAGIVAEVRRQIASLIPTAQEEADHLLCPLVEEVERAALELACWQAPGETSHVAIQMSVDIYYAESDDGYRPAGRYSENVTRCQLRWWLPTQEGCPSQFSDYGGHSMWIEASSKEVAMQEAGSRLTEHYNKARRKLEENLDRAILPASYAGFLSDEERETWAANFKEAVSRQVAQTLALAENLRAETVEHRREIYRQWLDVKVLEEQVSREADEARSLWRQVMRSSDLPDRPGLAFGSLDEMRESANALNKWAADIRIQIEAEAAKKGQAVVTAAQKAQMESNAPSVPWHLFGVTPEEVAKSVGRKPGEGIGLKDATSWKRLPGESPLVAVQIHRGGGKRYAVEVVSNVGVEMIYDAYDARSSRGELTWVGLVVASDWKIVWQRYKDGEPWGDRCWADASGIHGEFCDWEGPKVLPWTIVEVVHE